MEKSIIGLLGGAATAIIAAAPALATPAQPAPVESAMQTNSYADLLKPIPTAGEILKASAQVPLAPSAGSDASVQQAQLNVWIGPRHRYHHHHHHHWWYHHHHHHD